jgi:hypothetical protein
VSDDQGSLKGTFTLLDLINPVLVVPHLIDGKLFTQSIVRTVISLDFSVVDYVLWEHVDWASDLLE